MSLVFEEKNRNIIPRWRNSAVSFLTGEFGSTKKKLKEFHSDYYFDEKKNVWLENKDISSAVELVYSAHILKKFKDAEEAASFILNNPNRIPKGVLDIAGEIISPHQIIQDHEFSKNILDHSVKHHRIRLLKVKLKDDPRNVIARIDLAREYTILGQYDKALHNVKLTLGLHKDNRFILRSIVRFFIHVGQVDFARHILEHSQSFLVDPWLMAAELACSSIMKKTSKFTKIATKLLSNENFAEAHLSELAVALGTQEFLFGDFKRSKKFFKKAQIQPNENSLAQIIWIYHQLGIKDFELNIENVSLMNEAAARDSFSKGEWKESLNESIRWFNDQPFSRGPAYFTTYLASGILEDYNTAIRVGEISLEANPNDFTLLNNIAFAYASAGNVFKAEEYFERIPTISLETHQNIVFKATHGLIQFRKQNFNEGHQLYSQAIEIALKNKLNKYAVRAAIYFKRELAIARMESDFNLDEFIKRHIKDENEMELIELNRRIDNLNKILNGPSKMLPIIK